MKKTIKRTLAIVMAVAMLFALSATAFADSDITVYVTIQKANVPTGNAWNYTLGDLTVTKTYATTVAVQVPAGSTVKDVVEAMSGVTIVNSCSCGNCGTHTSYGCTCSSTSCTCTWKQVANVYWNGSAFVPDGTYSSAMNSLQYTYYDPDLEDDDTVILTNSSSYAQEGNYTRYTGDSWEYFTAASSSDTNVYSNTEYMSQFVVSDGLYITLSYDHSTFLY